MYNYIRKHMINYNLNNTIIHFYKKCIKKRSKWNVFSDAWLVWYELAFLAFCLPKLFLYIAQIFFLPIVLLKYFKVPSKGPVCVNTGSSCVSPGETAVRVPSRVWSKSEWRETKTDKKTDWVKEASQTQQAENNTLIIISAPAVDALELIRSTKPCRNKICYAGQRRPVKPELNPTVFTDWFQTLWHFSNTPDRVTLSDVQ